ncbi:siderophore-interacting protein [Streptomyces halstedii]|uniref:siderophore-interacting protein n=2 Tax=Streptomyces TaxID=1883 RepID=UPI00048CAA92|nr:MULTISPECIES: siderophore-interacting protein [Streptomyces]MYR76734.1 SIP domain-containing protein [Streptomyces sp. SID4925]MYY16848.1 SIP domain-containing protein [Streptomyces sp. SID4912]SBU96744.1 NADPH-dependent ferric siderophore reductase, contains FAD-binding and SIP domains [Streptomyces sp. OspMP-M45]SCD57189.1 NADPH-dependent ferric siderophore reductase, contains FAD-binding and SIP domains [Streptomyces sp. PpalLS-921]SCE13762.1 NADPH-dependent ferric siderophore reductase,
MSRTDHRHRHLDRIAEVRAGRHAEKVGYPIGIRRVEVVRTAPVGSGLLRVTLGGEGAEGFEAHAPDEHVKLIFPEPDGTLRLPEPNGAMLRWPRPVPTSREYTVRRYDPASGEIDIDIAWHDGGLASDWASAARPGAVVHVAGPPGGLIVPPTYDRYLLAGDITALPAVARWLEEMPRTARGWAFVEVADASQEIELWAPEGVEVRWLHRGDLPAGAGDALERAVTAVTVPEGERVYVWVAGEAGQIKPLRRWVRDELRLEKADYDITGYWKRGVADFDEDDH